MDISKNSSSENMLVMHKAFENMYDTCQLVIYDYDDELVCKILDESIRGELIDADNIGLGTFNDHDGKSLTFRNASRPLRRLIRFRAACNRATAIDEGYIGEKDLFGLLNRDLWSPTGLNEKEALDAWFKCLPGDTNYKAVPEDKY